MLAVVGIAAAALGTGFLGNDIELWIQQFGVGSGVIVSPIAHVQVDFLITQEPQSEGTFLNVADCVLTLETPVGAVIGSFIMGTSGALVEKDSELTCKFTDRSRAIIAEGTIGTPSLDDPNDPLFPACVITQTCAQTTGVFPAGEYVIPIGEDVRNVHDVIVVVHANTYNAGDPIP